MKKLSYLMMAIAGLLLLLSTSCKKDNDTDPNQNSTPQFELQEINVPAGLEQSSEPGALETMANIQLVKSISGFTAMMVPPGKSSGLNLKNGDPEIISWEFNQGSDNYTATLTVLETDTYIKWTMVIDGILDGKQVNNFTFLHAEEFKDGSPSTFIVYDIDNPGTIAMQITWYNQAGTLYVTFEVPEETLITMEVHADGSGKVEVKEWYNGEYLLDYISEWDANGHGEAWDYNLGELVDHLEY